MSKVRYGYTLEKNLSESISVKKYYSVVQVVLKRNIFQKLVCTKTNKLLILIISNLSLYIDYIKKSNRPLIIFHLSDERYDFFKTKVYKNKNIKYIIRNYKIFSFLFLLKSFLKWPLITVKWIYSYWINNIKNNKTTTTENLKHFKYILFSIKYLLMQIIIALQTRKIATKIIYAPLNETNFYNISKKIKAKKKYSIFFAGSLHSSERIYAYSIAKKIGFSHGYYGWGWTSKQSLTPNSYLKFLKYSKYILCPTGYVNLDTFRFYEIIKSGSLPIVPKETPFQPFNYFSKIYNLDERITVNLFTEENIQNKIKSISNKDYYLILKKLRKSIETKNKRIKDLLDKY